MIVCLAVIVAIVILAILRIKSKALAVVAAVLLSCIVMLPFSCCAGKWHESYKKNRTQRIEMQKQLKKELKEQKKAQEKADKAQKQQISD